MLTENITSLVEKPVQTKRYTISDFTPGLPFVVSVAQSLGLEMGEVFDLLLRNFLPMAEYNEDVRAQAAKRRTVIQVNPVVLMWFLDAKSVDTVGRNLSNNQFLTYMLQDLPDTLIVELLMRACSISDGYKSGQYTTIVCPRKLFSLLTKASKLNKTHKGATMSAFIHTLMQWLRRTESKVDAVVFDKQREISPAALREMMEYAFSLGMVHED